MFVSLSLYAHSSAAPRLSLGQPFFHLSHVQAIRSGDPEAMRRAQLAIAHRRLRGSHLTPGRPLFTPGGTVARSLDGHTPRVPSLTPRHRALGSAVDGDLDEPGHVEVPAMGLDAFLATHTSEDNASFGEIVGAENVRRREKAARLLQAAAGPALLTEGRERTDGFGTSGQAPDTLTGWKYTPVNALMYDGSNRDSLPLSTKEVSDLVEGPPKAIAARNTRFRPVTRNGAASPSTSVDTDSMGGSVTGSGLSGGHAKGARGGGKGYNILSTPSFDPGVDASPIVTWGDIQATPMRIEAEDLPPGGGAGQFRMHAPREREAQGHRLANKASASLRRRNQTAGGVTPSLAGTPAAAVAAAAAGRMGRAGLPPMQGGVTPGRRHAPLSAAAQRLARSVHQGRQGEADLGLRASYAGTPSRAGGSSTPAHSHGSNWTPSATPSRGVS